LEDQRKRLSNTDAEGRVLLAQQYTELLDDRATAKELLIDALRIDSTYRAAEVALRQLGFRKTNDEWVDARAPAAAVAKKRERESEPAEPSGELLRGLTRAQVRLRMGGPPDVIVRSASQGEVVEQWIYHGLSGTQYINLVRRANRTQPVVEAYYTLPP
jgi:hypothetical protein